MFKDPFAAAGSESDPSGRSSSPLVPRFTADTSGATLHRPNAPANVSAGHALNVTSSKAVADTMAMLKDGLAEMHRKYGIHDAQLEALENNVSTIEGIYADLSHDVGVLCAENRAMIETINQCLSCISRLEDELESLHENGIAPSADGINTHDVDGQHKGIVMAGNDHDMAGGKKQRNNRLSNIVRAAMYHLIGIDSKTVPPSSLHEGVFWSGEVGDENRALRPNWETWNVNKVAWVREIVQKIQTDGMCWHSGLTSEQLQNMAMSDIEVAINSVWETMRARVKASQKSKAEHHVNKIKNRRTARKKKPASVKRSEMMFLLELKGAEYDYLFDWKYQSTDESQRSDQQGPIQSDAVSSDDDSDAPRSKTKPWISHPPTYHLAAVEPLVVRLDQQVFRAHQRSNNAQGNTYHSHIRGARAEKELPSRKGAKAGALISRSQVSAGWLAAHPVNDLPSHIAMDVEVNENENDVDDEDGEGPQIDPALQ
ncbi:hypothetical protein SCP_0212980 [Sparassis crispa]|uniref:Uncharacterized protein n=1 Tax=Sparassis crispa TaxID=139825 RepID=A0A401GD77_9APHY|nr:hypothetical protein SCP_0212980 [Sparassis crispa]GBE80095.1 hypothetical protein SCP_0212980 [Sparassis crispa]